MDVVIRLANEADSAAIAAIYRPYVEEGRVSFEDSAPGDAEMARRITGERPGFHPWLVAEQHGRPVGYASSSPFRSRAAYRWAVETGIYLARGQSGHGLGRQLLGTLLTILEQQGYVAAIGAIALPNGPSVALHEKLGFAHTGTYRGVGFKMGEWLDVGLWQRELARRTADPHEPSPFRAVID